MHPVVGRDLVARLLIGIIHRVKHPVRPEHVGRGAGMFMLTYYVGAAFSGLIFAWLVGRVGWEGAGLWQLTLLPLVGLAGLGLVRTSQMLVPYASPSK